MALVCTHYQTWNMFKNISHKMEQKTKLKPRQAATCVYIYIFKISQYTFEQWTCKERLVVTNANTESWSYKYSPPGFLSTRFQLVLLDPMPLQDPTPLFFCNSNEIPSDNNVYTRYNFWCFFFLSSTLNLDTIQLFSDGHFCQ